MYTTDNLKNILLKQYKMHPKMQIEDFIKLIFQNEFAGGHLINDKNESLSRLEEEYSQLSLQPDQPLYEYIGNDIFRLNLSGIKDTSISLETVNNIFVNTANKNVGTIQNFEKKLEVLKDCLVEYRLPFNLEELEIFLEEYKTIGYPAISHSTIYREEYLPSYRIINKKYIPFLRVFEKIDTLLQTKRSISIAIDGNSGSGKSTLANILNDIYDCNIFHMDDFFLTLNLRTSERLAEVGGNVDYGRFNNEVICGLNSKSDFNYQKYDCRKMKLDEFVSVSPKRLNIIEGSYSMHPTLIGNYDLKIFLQIDGEEQVERILKRNGSFMLQKFIDEWIPKENIYFEKMNIPAKADLIFDM